MEAARDGAAIAARDEAASVEELMNRSGSGFWETTAWPHLEVGRAVTVLKLHPDGREGARYPGVVVASRLPAPWVSVEARWTQGLVEVSGLRFETGDTLIEHFSPAHPFNAFQVLAPDGAPRGWYANVTYPARLDTSTDPWTVTWPDLYLDVVALPDGSYAVRDEDELAEADLLSTDPVLHGAILAAGAELVARFRRRDMPFHER